jgi:hypothetical protein
MVIEEEEGEVVRPSQLSAVGNVVMALVRGQS